MKTRFDNLRSARVPRAREELLAIADRLDLLDHADEARHIREVVAGLMVRLPRSKQTARARQVPITGQLVSQVLDFARRNPRMHERDIGRHFGIDGGRVSEILNGHRTPANPTMRSA